MKSSVGGPVRFVRGSGTNAAAIITDGPAHMIDVSNFLTYQPTVGASLVFWIKPDPSVPARPNWSPYQCAGSPVAQASRIADQWFVVGQSNFIVMGGGNDQHSFWPGHKDLIDGYDVADWHMIAVVADDEVAVNDNGMNRFRVYLNGELYGSIVNNSTLVQFYPNASWTFADPSSYGFDNYIGDIDDIRFFTRALDVEEIRILLNENRLFRLIHGQQCKD